MKDSRLIKFDWLRWYQHAARVDLRIRSALRLLGRCHHVEDRRHQPQPQPRPAITQLVEQSTQLALVYADLFDDDLDDVAANLDAAMRAAGDPTGTEPKSGTDGPRPKTR
jgi:hypothetical protein